MLATASARRKQEILYVVSGTGTLRLGSGEHPLEPEPSVFLGAGETYEVETAEGLMVVSVTAPAGREREQSPTVTRFADCEEKRANEDRETSASSSTLRNDVTQFVGLVMPCRAPDHRRSLR